MKPPEMKHSGDYYNFKNTNTLQPEFRLTCLLRPFNQQSLHG